MRKHLILCAALFLSAGTQAQGRFEQAVALIKQAEGMHTAQHHPYVGYGHRLRASERFTAKITERLADSLLRSDLRQKCRVFRSFGRDSLLLGVLAYNVGEYTLLGGAGRSRSRLIRKLEAGDRDIYGEYVTFRKYKGKVLPSLERRRRTEFSNLIRKINMDRHITIAPSEGLARMRLSGLAGRKGVIVEDLTDEDRNDKGYMVQLYHPYMDETLWYIPEESAGHYE